MVFSSVIFLFYFLPLTLFVYYFARHRNFVFLVASLLFYSWGEIEYLYLLMASCVINYAFGLMIEKRRPFSAKTSLVAGVSVNILTLIFFKYTNFLVDSANSFLPETLRLSVSAIKLPLGISFFTFHSLSYLVDIYRKKVTAEKNPVNLMLYITMFPQLVAGPIIRFSIIADEIRQRTESSEKFVKGIKIFVIGLAQKVLIANTIAAPADKIFSLPVSELNAGLAWLSAIFYTIQIYFDFAGYSNMAIGLGHMFGLTFPENFNYPYISQSITEFWRRWHMTLSQWFRDYVYIPLGGNQAGKIKTYRNLFIVFFLCGLWHGANWTFAAWGIYHGLFLIFERMGLGGIVEKAWRPIRHAYTIILVIIGWVLFRSDTFTQASMHLKAMAGFGTGKGLVHNANQYLDNNGIIMALIAGVLFSVPISVIMGKLSVRIENIWSCNPLISNSLGFVLTSMLYMVLAVLVIMSLAASSYNPFIYFRF
ncbi:MBOAT family O-acyltransferase [Desulforegula conservatrix]|uniref:MBOAT family O-acyltransferase n=1 Tax=Desulforegula conservatrix TaxID=153026 RepID=UPI00040310BB|nr:MBOAT family O-acyltransferase [Desulforegula conservatrix]